MAKGFDDIKNGLLFGVVFGVLLLYASINISTIGFVSTWMDKLVTWLTAQSWMSWYTFGYLNYVLAGIFGAIIGAYIDSR
jgi:hypothetical protein